MLKSMRFVRNALLIATIGAWSVTPALAQKATSVPAKAPEISAKPLKIGVVNTERLVRESAPAREAEAQIETEFKKRDADLQTMGSTLREKHEHFDKNSRIMGDAERNRLQRELSDLDTQWQRKRREFQEDLNRRRNDAFAMVVDKANAAIRTVAAEHQFDVILQDAVFVSERADITDMVIEVLNRK